MNECKRCLLYELADKSAYNSVHNYLEAMPDEDKVSDTVYSRRLDVCRRCDSLLAGTCRKCGCYVEIRAMQNKSDCPAGAWEPGGRF